MKLFAEANAQLDRLKESAARRQFLMKLAPSAGEEWPSYKSLQHSSLALAGIVTRSGFPSVNLMLPSLSEDTLFAGLRTAIVFAARCARAASMPLRVLYFGAPKSAAKTAHIQRLISDITGLPTGEVQVRSAWSLVGETFTDADIWVATYWSTAHAINIACNLGKISPSRVLYLVQDYEPEFFPGSTQSALSRATYHAGFQLVVNSAPLADYLEYRERVIIDPDLVFRPELDIGGLSRAAERRVPHKKVRVTFYGRPSKPRNSFQLGVSALQFASVYFRRAGVDAEFVSVGEKHAPIRLKHHPVRSLGKLPWAEYFDFLASTDVMFSLQQTPHPSHPPLDAVGSGGFAVTNDYGQTRGRLSPRLLAASDDPRALAEAILVAAQRARAGELRSEVDNQFIAELGLPMKQVAKASVGRIV